MHTLPDVVIEDYRLESFSYGASRQTIDTAYLQAYSNQYLADLMRRLTPAYGRSYGNGMLTSVSLRGTGSERTSVVWNGFSINYPNLGTGDHSVYSAGGFNRVQVHYGPSSANFGNSSIGGAVVLGYVPEFKKAFRLGLSQEYGSYNSLATGFQATYGTSFFQGNTYFQRSSAANNFAYRDMTTVGFPVKETVNARYDQYTVLQDLFFKWKNMGVDVHGWWSRMDRQIPPAMGAANTHAQELDQSFRIALSAHYRSKWGKTKISGAFFRDEIYYHDDGLDDSSVVNTYQVQAEQDLYFVKKWTFKLGGQFQYFAADQAFYQGARYEPRGAVFLLVNYTPFSFLRFTYNLRQQWVKGYSPPITGNIGGEWDFLRKYTIAGRVYKGTWRINMANGYRVPTLNDRFWIPGGSDTLKAEYSWNFETGLDFKFYHGKNNHSVSLIGYYGWADDWIQWQPTSMGFWAPVNLGRVELAGAEVKYTFDHAEKNWEILAEAGYALTYATDRTQGTNNGNELIYVPRHTVTGRFEVSYRGIYLQGYAKFTGNRYIRADNSQSIPAYFLLDLALGKTFHLWFMDIGVSFKINNTTHTNYQTIENRPMPGIHYLAGVQLGFGHTNIRKTNKNNKL